MNSKQMASQFSGQQELNAQLQQRGFDFASPDLGLAWDVFKDFMQVLPSGCISSQIGFECQHICDRDETLFLQLACDIENEIGTSQIGCLFSRQVPEEMRSSNASLWWSPLQEAGVAAKGRRWSLNDFFTAVEAMPAFKTCLMLDSWQWES